MGRLQHIQNLQRGQNLQHISNLQGGENLQHTKVQVGENLQHIISSHYRKRKRTRIKVHVESHT